MRALVIGLISFSLIALPSTSQAIQSGDSCKKVGSVKKFGGKTFTCLKKGKKAVWRIQKSSSQAAAPKPSPSPTQIANPFQTPFPDEFTRTEMLSAVFTNFDSYVAANSSAKSYKLVVGPEIIQNLADIRVFVDKTYSALPFPKDYQRTIVVVTTNREFGEVEIKNFGFDRSDSNGAAGGPCMNCAGEGWAVSDFGLGAVTPHEIFHVWQKAAYKRKGNNNPDPNNYLNPPVWFDEGSADFFGYQMLRIRTKSYESVLSNREVSSLKKYSTRDLDPGLPYLLGRVASEYIVASVGMERFLQIFFNVGDGLDFPTAFERAVGIPLETFYEKFDRNISKLLG